MKKLKSSLTNMVVVLTATTALAGFLLGYVYSATSGARQEAEDNIRVSALRSVLGDYTVSPDVKPEEITLPDGKTTVTIYPVYDNGRVVAAGVESLSMNGFSGEIDVMVGIDVNGTILGYEVTKHAETPGLGAKMNDWFRDVPTRMVAGRNAWQKPLAVTAAQGDIDAITAATISSKAFLEAINNAADGFRIFMQGNEAAKKIAADRKDASTGATSKP